MRSTEIPSCLLALGIGSGLCNVLVRQNTKIDLFPFEKVQLDQQAAAGTHIRPRIGNDTPPPPPPANATAILNCKAFPGNVSWPSQAAWNELAAAVNGSLLKPAPAASVCYNGTAYANYNATSCAAVSSGWSTAFIRMDHPIEVVSPMVEGLTCLPPTEGFAPGCTQGGYPTYVVNVSAAAHIQAAVNFARNHNVRLVIKNTGHDFSGKSLGAGALSVWTHHLKDIEFLSNFTTDGYTGPAFKVGAGVQASEILKAASDKKHMVATGICDSVGIYGGYSQGGGHTPLGALHGMGADQILSLQVVTADGQFRTASPTENTDLFWAIRGGGGSTFGVVTSMVVKAFPDAPVAVATFDWGVRESNISVDAFWHGLASYFGHFENFTDNGLWAQFNIYPQGTFGPKALAAGADGQPRIAVSPFFGIGKTLDQLKAGTATWLDEMLALGINVTTTWEQFTSFYPAFFSHLPHTDTGVMQYSMGYGSRLIPRRAFDRNRGLNTTVAAYRQLAELGHSFNGFQLSPTLAKAKPVGPEGNAVLPAWRDALSHTIVFQPWPQNATAAEQLAIRHAFATGDHGLKLLRDVTPGSGSYMSEADRLEPNFQQAFFGSNYPRLLAIKKKYDPQDVFYANTAVGSEFWTVRSVDGLPNENGPLCRV